MTRTEIILIDRCNQLTMMVFLQELRVRALAEQNRQANAVIETAADTLREMTAALLGQVEVYSGEGDRMV